MNIYIYTSLFYNQAAGVGDVTEKDDNVCDDDENVTETPYKD